MLEQVTVVPFSEQPDGRLPAVGSFSVVPAGIPTG